jgi:hypothetical protein
MLLVCGYTKRSIRARALLVQVLLREGYPRRDVEGARAGVNQRHSVRYLTVCCIRSDGSGSLCTFLCCHKQCGSS